MIDIPMESIVQRLNDTGVFREVIHALTFSLPKSYPSAYVFILREKADDNILLGTHSQRITGEVSIEIMDKHLKNADLGEGAGINIRSLRIKVMEAMLGWSMTNDFSPFNFSGGDLVSYSNGFVVWRDQYTTSFYRNKV